MCQLTLTSLNNRFLNYIAVMASFIANSKNNKDGWGLFSPKTGVLKSEKNAGLDTELSELIHPFIDKNPVISHVRLASASNRVICVENSHPFESEHFILAHNGTLKAQTESQWYCKDKIDSENFLNQLQFEYLTDNNFLASLTRTIENHFGKFAFMIYNKVDKKHYIIRGDDATLYKSYAEINGKRGGIIVNTVYTDLEGISELSKRFAGAIKKKIVFTKPEILPANSLFVLDVNNSELERIETSFKERKIPTKIDDSWNDYAHLGNYGIVSGKPSSTQSQLKDDKVKDFKKMSSWLMHLTIEEYDELFFHIFNKGILSSSINEVVEFTQILKSIMYSREGALDAKKKVWRKIARNGAGVTFYNKHKIQFPWFVIRARTLRKLKQSLDNGLLLDEDINDDDEETEDINEF